AGKERIDDQRWHYVAGVYEGSESRSLRLYVDGAEQASAQVPLPYIPSKLSQWLIGTSFEDGTVHGTVDDARIYQRALRSDEIRSLHRCMSGANDMGIDGRDSYYFAPVFGDHVEILPPRPGDKSAGVRNNGTDFSGVTFVKREPDCGLRSVRGADIGQDL